jgi:hypothetical protein
MTALASRSSKRGAIFSQPEAIAAFLAKAGSETRKIGGRA